MSKLVDSILLGLVFFTEGCRKSGEWIPYKGDQKRSRISRNAFPHTGKKLMQAFMKCGQQEELGGLMS